MARIPNTSQQALNLFAVLLDAPGAWRHGYSLSRDCGLQSGTLYPLLIRLSDQGLLESRWETDGPNRRPRHVYRLTTKGLKHAKAQLTPGEYRANKPRLSKAAT
jgi:DNA-binding PadR family transcriptional regulator